MPRGAADRPVRRTAEEAALQAAMVRALEQGAAAVAAVRPDPVPAGAGTGVAATAPLRGIAPVAASRPARSFVLAKAKRKEKKDPPPPDPRGRGGRVDVRL